VGGCSFGEGLEMDVLVRPVPMAIFGFWRAGTFCHSSELPTKPPEDQIYSDVSLLGEKLKISIHIHTTYLLLTYPNF
jgi:hypothetical protein